MLDPRLVPDLPLQSCCIQKKLEIYNFVYLKCSHVIVAPSSSLFKETWVNHSLMFLSFFLTSKKRIHLLFPGLPLATKKPGGVPSRHLASGYVVSLRKDLYKAVAEQKEIPTMQMKKSIVIFIFLVFSLLFLHSKCARITVISLRCF